MDITVRPIAESEVDAFRAAIARGFGEDPFEEEDASHFLDVFEIDRLIAAFDGDEVVGTCGAFTFDLTVPGGTLPMGGTTIITVQPTHRRRGVLRKMMQAHLDEMRGKGEPLAGLWASESGIYGRFGYGLAAECATTTIDTKSIAFTGEPPEGMVRLVSTDDAASILPELYDRVRPTRPGMLSRREGWWRHRVLRDVKHRRGGRSQLRIAVHYGGTGGADGPTGYAIYRQKEEWGDFPKGEVHVVEVMAPTPEAHEALWRYLTRIDLFPHVKYWNTPVDDELPWRVTEGRRVERKIWDTLWLRPIDIGRAMEGRKYASAAKIVLGVSDPAMPDNDGCYELDASPDGARCRRTSADPDVELGVDTLGAIYLGAPRTRSLARARLIKGGDEAVSTLERVMAWSPAPWCEEVF